jgi:hypothetical protein
VKMAFLGGSQCSVLVAMTMAVFVEKKEAKDIGEKAKRSDDEDQNWVGDRLRFSETLNSFEKDG